MYNYNARDNELLKSTAEQILNEHKYIRKINLEKYFFLYLLCDFSLKTKLTVKK